MAINYQYINKDTAIHHLNPLSKLAWTIVIIIITLTYNNPIYLLLFFCSLIPVIFTAQIKAEWKTTMKFSLLLGLLIIFINILFSQYGTHILYQLPFRIPLIGSPRITLEAILYGLGNALRLITIISAFIVLTLTTHPDDIMLLMQSMRLPYKTVLLTSLSTRFIPTLAKDLREIREAQQCRGLELHQKKLLPRVKSSGMIIIPLLSNSLDRTVQIAEAMEARGFNTLKSRTSFQQIRYSKIDFIMFILIISCLIFSLWAYWQGWGNYQYYPTLGKLFSGRSDYVVLGCLSILLFSYPLLASLKRRTEFD